MKNNIKKGVLFALSTSIISGFAIFYSKISVAKIDPLVLTTARNLYVGIIFLILFLVSFRLNEIKKLKKKDLFPLIMIGVIGGSLPFYLFFAGLGMVETAMIGNLIHKTLFIWVAFLAFFFLKEKLNLVYLISFALVFIGSFYFSFSKFSFGQGEIMILSATLLWSVENIIAKKVLKNISADMVGLFRMGIGSLVLIPMVFLSGKGNMLMSLDLKQLSVIFIGGTILFFYVFTWYRSLKYSPASLATMILVFSTVVGNVLNGSFAHIKIAQTEIYSSIFITIAVLLILIKLFKYSLICHLDRSGEIPFKKIERDSSAGSE